VIDGQGSRFVFHDRVFPFAALHCDGITLQNFSMTFSFMRYCVADAVVSDDGVSLAIDEALWQYNVSNDGNLTFSVGDETMTTSEKKFFAQQGGSVCYIGAGKRYYEPKNLPASFIDTMAEKIDGGVFLRYQPGSVHVPFTNGRLVLNYDEDRQNDNFFFEACKDVKMENVTLFRGAGMGVVTQLCENVELSHLMFRAGENGDEIYSVTADGLFFTQDSGKVFVHDCNIANTMDDAVSMHNVYGKVEQMLSDTKLRVRLCHVGHAGFNPFLPGDVLTISDGQTQAEKGQVTVKAAAFGNDIYAVIMDVDKPIAGTLAAGDLLENHQRSPLAIFRNNVFTQFPSIRLASAKPVWFGMNTVSHFNKVAVNDLMAYWYTYGPSDNVTFIGNTFDDAHDACISCTVDRVPDAHVCHGKVTVMRNMFKRSAVGIAADHVKDLQIAYNGFSFVDNHEKMGEEVNVSRIDTQQLLMRRDAGPVLHTPIAPGFEKFTFRRGGDERMDMQTYIDGWFNVSPDWSLDEFYHFYNDDRIPEDGHFLIRKQDGEIVAHSNIQLNEHKPNTATVHFVAVKEECRGYRLGYSVSEMVLDYAEEHHVPIMYLTTDEFRIPAIKIYLKLGFRPVMWDKDMRARWFPILKEIGCNEIYDEEEKLITVDLFGV